MKINFIEDDEKTYSVEIDNGEEFTKTYGKLIYTKYNYGGEKIDAWVLWPADWDDAVTYFDDLEETKESIKDEITDYFKDLEETKGDF